MKLVNYVCSFICVVLWGISYPLIIAYTFFAFHSDTKAAWTLFFIAPWKYRKHSERIKEMLDPHVSGIFTAIDDEEDQKQIKAFADELSKQILEDRRARDRNTRSDPPRIIQR